MCILILLKLKNNKKLILFWLYCGRYLCWISR